MRRAILEALRTKYEAEIAEADATANIYLDNSVGIGEHPQHIEEVVKLAFKKKYNHLLILNKKPKNERYYSNFDLIKFDSDSELDSDSD